VFQALEDIAGHGVTGHGHGMTMTMMPVKETQTRDGAKGRVLLIEDRSDLSAVYAADLRAAGFTVDTCEAARPALAALRSPRADYDCLVTDYMLPDLNGLEILKIVQHERPELPLIFITGHGDMQTTIEAMKYGAFDYLEKPIRANDLEKAVAEAAAKKRSRVQRIRVEGHTATADLLVGRSAAMVELYKNIGRVAAQATPVLVTGPTGGGKELVARAIHQNGPRVKGAFAAVNCAAIPEALLESELFGHEKGAFTGATAQRRGLLESAEGGTVFLDEIGDMPRALQAKLLRVLQEKTVQRVGGDREVPIDVRVISATHRNLLTMIKAGEFREDLYHRLAGYEIAVPALAQRLDDVPMLAHYFTAKYAAEFELKSAGIDAGALEFLQQRTWPGNVRQFQNVIRRALMRTRNFGIDAAAVAAAYAEFTEAVETGAGAGVTAGENGDGLHRWVAQAAAEEGDDSGLREKLIDRLDAALIRYLWTRTGGNRSRMADVLGVTRLTLRRKMEKLGGFAECD
jgi:DNA-binding NtrC family response regulator